MDEARPILRGMRELRLVFSGSGPFIVTLQQVPEQDVGTPCRSRRSLATMIMKTSDPWPPRGRGLTSTDG
jgi:hypothetical protein